MPKPLPEHEEKAIRQYVESESIDHDDPDNPDNKVTLVQKVASYRLLGTDYDVYDVHMPMQRWWVITELTNLYSQADFPNYDVAFSFHVGLMMRMWERERVEIEEDKADEVGAAWRRLEAAREAMDSAREAEDYQGIGIMCREALIAFAREHQGARWLTPPEAPPKAADFKAWATLYAQALATGRMRRYLSEVADKNWDIAVSLCPASSSWQDFFCFKGGGGGVGQAEVHLQWPVPGDRLMRALGVVLDSVVLGPLDERQGVRDLVEEQPLVLQRPEPAFA